MKKIKKLNIDRDIISGLESTQKINIKYLYINNTICLMLICLSSIITIACFVFYLIYENYYFNILSIYFLIIIYFLLKNYKYNNIILNNVEKIIKDLRIDIDSEVVLDRVHILSNLDILIDKIVLEEKIFNSTQYTLSSMKNNFTPNDEYDLSLNHRHKKRNQAKNKMIFYFILMKKVCVMIDYNYIRDRREYFIEKNKKYLL